MTTLNKLKGLSNYYYNEGLNRARVHNITGAIESLQKSLDYYKGNIEARNLLGLCYYQVGESVHAMKEWVISVNFQQENNIAANYISDLKPEMTRTGRLNQCIKKYNQALIYANQGSLDLAAVQLKKVCSMNPQYVRAHLLLALIYLHQEEFRKAKEVLRKAGKVDANNTMLLTYLREANEGIKGKGGSVGKEPSDSLEYNSGGQTIIRPAYFKDNATISTVINIIFGLIVGFAVAFFLMVPGVKRAAESESASKLVELNDTVSSKNVTIQSLQQEIEGLNEELKAVKGDSENSEASANFYKEMLAAYAELGSEDYEAAANAILSIDKSVIDEDFKSAYKKLKKEVISKYLKQLYTDASAKYNYGKNEEAAELYQKILDLDENYSEGNAMYYCAQAYRKAGEKQKAIVLYQKFIELYPDTDRANNAAGYIKQLGG